MAKNTRQELYDRIRQTSKDEVILEEMQRLGFWPDEQGKPEGTEALIKRQGELQRELSDLMSRQHMYADPEQALKEMRKQRMAESKQRRIETKKRHLQEKYDRAVQWHERRQHEILYLGSKVSSGLNDNTSDTARLSKYTLPEIHSAKQLAELMGVPLAELRFLAFDRDVSKVSHYKQFYLSKKTGGERLISAPMPRMKRAQYWILDNILQKLPVHDAAHGFRAGRSIVSNAKPHVGSYMVVNCDMQNFFPTFDYARVKGVFLKMGYANQIASILALICTEPQTREVELDNETFYVSDGERCLPQGAPTSPVLTNIICRRLDHRLNGMARSLGFTYTRYADDITFSCDRMTAKKLGKLKMRLESIVDTEGLVLHPKKTRIMRACNQQEVTGVVVNDRTSIDRKTLKRFRATLHQIEKDGPAGKRWGNSNNVLNAIKGYANYVAMVHPEKGQQFVEQVKIIIKQHGHKPTYSVPTALTVSKFRQQAASGTAPRENWWLPTEPPEPVLEKLPEKKIPEIQRPQRSDDRTTLDIIREATRSNPRAYRPTVKVRAWTWWRRIKTLLWISALVYFITKMVAGHSPLGIIIVIATVYFIYGLSRM